MRKIVNFSGVAEAPVQMKSPAMMEEARMGGDVHLALEGSQELVQVSSCS